MRFFLPDFKGLKWGLSFGQMIKQSQDDGGDVVTYHKTPVMERLETIVKERNDIEISLKASQFLNCPEKHNMSKILLNASTLNRSPIRHCLEKEVRSCSKRPILSISLVFCIFVFLGFKQLHMILNLHCESECEPCRSFKLDNQICKTCNSNAANDGHSCLLSLQQHIQ